MTKPNTECPHESSIFTADAQGKQFHSHFSVHIADLWGFLSAHMYLLNWLQVQIY